MKGIGRLWRRRQHHHHQQQQQLCSSSSSSSSSSNGRCNVPVVIVGAGPVGLLLSILLSHLGVKCKILEKNKALSTHPQAHFINNRSMEVFRKLNGLADDIQKLQAPVETWRNFIYCTSLTGPILGSVDHLLPQDFQNVVSPISVSHLSQYKLNTLLLHNLHHLNFNDLLQPGELLFAHDCIALDVSNDLVTATVSTLKDGIHTQQHISCNILVAADGARSTVRKLVGIQLRGEKELQRLVSVHFLSKHLGQYLLSHTPGMLFFVFNTEAIGVLVAHDLKQGEFVLQVPFFPPQQNLEDFSIQRCKELIFTLAGREFSDVDVVGIKPWVMHAEVAEKFVSCNNRIILAGDAAHRFPPAGGFGMNTGIQDAHNLAWKIASVMKGIAPYSLLNTYETERRPIAIYNTALSIQNFNAAMAVPAALGLDPAVANSVHKVITDGVGSVLPSRLQRAVLDGIFTLGRAQLSSFLLNEDNPLGSARLAKLRHIFEEGKSLQLQFPAEDLGFRYSEGALLPDHDSASGPLEPPTGRRRDYIPSGDPGSRLPHMKVRKLSTEVTISTHDLVSVDRIEFLLIVSPLEDSYHLARAAFKVAEEFGVSMKVCILWPVDAVDGDEARSKTALAPWENYVDVMEGKKSSDTASWWSMCQMTDKGAILVRPDEHIAWRAKSSLNGDPSSEMRMVFSATLGFR